MIIVCIEVKVYMWDNQNIELAREKQLIIPKHGDSYAKYTRDRQRDDTT